jgi:hypothetical protein
LLGVPIATGADCSFRLVIDMSATAPPDAENMGVGAAQLEFSSWGWAFRSQQVKDYGIDAHAEPFDGLRVPKTCATWVNAWRSAVGGRHLADGAGLSGSGMIFGLWA